MTIAALFAQARERLAAAPRDALGLLVVPKRILGLARAPRIVPAGDAWHLGVLLVGDDDVWATGEIVRAREEAPRGFTAESQRERAAMAGAAWRGGFPEGMPVHVGWTPIDLAALERGEQSGPLAPADGGVGVRWSSSGGLMPLATYLDERASLLVDPPGGA